MDKGKRIGRETWLRRGAELAEALRALGERAKLERARAVVWAQAFRGAPPWPGREESDRRFREAWEAFERADCAPQRGWEPDRSDPCSPESSPEIQDYRFEEAGAVCEAPVARVTEEDRDILVAWLEAGSPMARRVMAWLVELEAASRAPIGGEGL